MQISLIAAVAQNGTIGRHNQLPWNIQDDMQFFLRTTRGHVVITGRNNYEAMGAPLPERINVVVTRRAGYVAPGCHVAASVEDALGLAATLEQTETFIIGGAQIYALAFPYAHCFYRTTVLANVAGDIKFPELDLSDFRQEHVGEGGKNAHNEHAFIIEKLTRGARPRTLARIFYDRWTECARTK